MNKRYMDFVPSQAKKETAAVKTKVAANDKPVAKKPVTKFSTKPASRATAKTERPKLVSKPATAKAETKPVSKPVSRPVSKAVVRELPQPELGVIEDLNPNYMSGGLSKRPLNSGKTVSAKEVKAQKVGTSVKKVDTPSATKGNDAKNATFAMPKSPFINQEKVVKRPLSKNVYAPKVEELKPEKSGPVTIIAKPEKDAHVSLIVTIIITIILGAAAGTVAFLLLPK